MKTRGSNNVGKRDTETKDVTDTKEAKKLKTRKSTKLEPNSPAFDDIVQGEDSQLLQQITRPLIDENDPGMTQYYTDLKKCEYSLRAPPDNLAQAIESSYQTSSEYTGAKQDEERRSDKRFGEGSSSNIVRMPYTPVLVKRQKKISHQIALDEPEYVKRAKLSKIDDSSADATSTVTEESSSDGKWNPIGFGMTNLYDFENGIPFSRSTCEANFAKLIKNEKETDYYPYLNLAHTFHGKDSNMEKLAVAMAVTTQQNNLLIRKLKAAAINKSSSNALIIPGHGFNLTDAKIGEEQITLPSGKCFVISESMSAYTAKDLTSTDFDSCTRRLFRDVFGRVAKRDPFFCAYASTRSSRKYLVLGPEFYSKIAQFVIRGFNQKQSDDLETRIMSLAKETLNNLLDRRRKHFKRKMRMNPAEAAKQLRKQIKEYGSNLQISKMDFNEKSDSEGSDEGSDDEEETEQVHNQESDDDPC